ncbi:MAG: AEC family transporter [Fervidobacterium pennivorans]|uniref:Transporter n=2 Tax=Fervidobacterium pennivorans TaxID=93466 RepID=A0A7V4CPB0_FERPE|nr:AEC family transporter [Fervidobacterium sp.]NPU88521.1 transporter [Fervidobacterium sp.]
MIYQAFGAVLPSFIMMFVGYIYGKLFREDITLFNKIATWLMAPIVTFAFMNDYIPTAGVLLRYGMGFSVMFAISFLISRLHKEDREIFFTGNVYVNSGYLGYPVLMALWGERALALGVVYSFVNVFVGSTLLPALIRGKLELKNILKLPFLYAIILGWGFGIAGISYKQLPAGVLTAFNWLKEMAIPFLLLQVGLGISRIKFETSSIKGYSFVVVERLLLIPLMLLPIAFFFEPLEAKVFLLECAMPIGVNSVVVIGAFKKELVPKAGMTVALTTLFSLVTLPFWAYVIERIFG